MQAKITPHSHTYSHIHTHSCVLTNPRLHFSFSLLCSQLINFWKLWTYLFYIKIMILFQFCRFCWVPKASLCVRFILDISITVYFSFIISFIPIPIPILRLVRCIIIKCIQTDTGERWPKESNEDKQIKDVDSLNRVLLYGHVAKVFVIFQLDCFYLCIQ